MKKEYQKLRKYTLNHNKRKEDIKMKKLLLVFATIVGLIGFLWVASFSQEKPRLNIRPMEPPIQRQPQPQPQEPIYEPVDHGDVELFPNSITIKSGDRVLVLNYLSHGVFSIPESWGFDSQGRVPVTITYKP